MRGLFMKEKLFKVLRIIGTVLVVFNLLMFYAMRPCWSGISSTIGYKNGAPAILYYLPVIICVLFLLIALADLILKAIFPDKKWLNITFLAVGFVFLIVIIVIIAMGAKDYMRFIWPKFFLNLAFAAVILAIYFILFIYPKTFLKDSKVFKFGILGLAGVVSMGFLLNFSINRISYKPVVYAVEKNYQIVFSTNSEATGWVEIDGKEYHDTYAGTAKKFTKVHKIEIPMTVLDAAKKYTVHTQRSIYCGPFGGFMGRDISQTVDFKPVDSSDGIQYLAFSDIHMNDWQTKKTASLVDKYDFLVLAGDAISDVETFEDANFINKVANKITGGSIPVVYARGNHDVKGRYAEETHRYTGAKGEQFYYNFYFNDVYGIVLDLGEDHDDDWWEYYDTAHYADYHAEQIEFLKSEILKHEYDGYKYHLAACHIPITFVNKRHNHTEVKKEMTELLNQMDIDMLLCGHQHDLMIFEPGLVTPETDLTYNSEYLPNAKPYKGYLTDFNFPSFMVSKPGFTYSDEPGLSSTKSQIGLYVDVDLVGMKETCSYHNSRGEKVDVMNMWAEKHYGTEITIDLNTKVFTSK